MVTPASSAPSLAADDYTANSGKMAKPFAPWVKGFVTVIWEKNRCRVVNELLIG
jgi:hypothetical protein